MPLYDATERKLNENNGNLPKCPRCRDYLIPIDDSGNFKCSADRCSYQTYKTSIMTNPHPIKESGNDSIDAIVENK